MKGGLSQGIETAPYDPAAGREVTRAALELPPGKPELRLTADVADRDAEGLQPLGRAIARLQHRDPQRVEATGLVRDQGQGIPPESIEQIFSSGFQARGAKAGHGLGLGIARKIVEQHGGRIHAENHPEGGAMFVFEMPRLQATR